MVIRTQKGLREKGHETLEPRLFALLQKNPPKIWNFQVQFRFGPIIDKIYCGHRQPSDAKSRFELSRAIPEFRFFGQLNSGEKFRTWRKIEKTKQKSFFPVWRSFRSERRFSPFSIFFCSDQKFFEYLSKNFGGKVSEKIETKTSIRVLGFQRMPSDWTTAVVVAVVVVVAAVAVVVAAVAVVVVIAAEIVWPRNNYPNDSLQQHWTLAFGHWPSVDEPRCSDGSQNQVVDGFTSSFSPKWHETLASEVSVSRGCTY